MDVKVEILEGLKVIRDSCLINMLDRRRVKEIADKFEYYELVGWLDEVDNKGYMKGLEEMALFE